MGIGLLKLPLYRDGRLGAGRFYGPLTSLRHAETADVASAYALSMDLSKEGDRYLFEELDAEQRKLPLNRDPEERKQIWREIFALRAELERRYPPSTETLA
jgi:hypothetical protein